MTTLSKETCAALKEMGVKTEAEFAVYARYKHENHVNYRLVSHSERFGYGYDDEIPAFTLSDLPHVLREMSKIQDWEGEVVMVFEDDGETLQEESSLLPKWKYHFMKMCGFFAEGGIEASEAYLLTLIK